ncbi:MAG: sulfatase-like hydrolase/transferase [Ilumatobacteraceae bacterium]
MQRWRVDKMRNWVGLTGATSPEVTRAAMAANYGAIEMIDDRVGQIMATIERLGQLDDTIVVFTADHGEMMGDHFLMLKGYMHYRGTLQVPLVVSDPRRTAARTTSLAASIDIGPTLMDLCGVETYHGVQGTSQLPVLDDPTASVRDSVLIEDDLDWPKIDPFPTMIRTLITPEHRYSRYNTGEDGVYELGTDDDERTNLASTRPELRSELIEGLTDAMMRHSERSRGAPVAEPAMVAPPSDPRHAPTAVVSDGDLRRIAGYGDRSVSEPSSTTPSRAAWKPLLALLRRQWLGLALGVGVGLLWTLGKIAVPQLVRLAIDRSIEGDESAWGWAALSRDRRTRHGRSPPHVGTSRSRRAGWSSGGSASASSTTSCASTSGTTTGPRPVS